MEGRSAQRSDSSPEPVCGCYSGWQPHGPGVSPPASASRRLPAPQGSVKQTGNAGKERETERGREMENVLRIVTVMTVNT